jgi:hypothetical protein
VARVHAHPRSMGPKMDSLLYAILGSLPRTRFVRPCGSDRQILKGVEARSGHACSLTSNACFPAASPSLPLLLPLSNSRLLYHCEGEYAWASYGDNNRDWSGGRKGTLPYTLACTVKSRPGPRRHSTAKREEAEGKGACSLARGDLGLPSSGVSWKI